MSAPRKGKNRSQSTQKNRLERKTKEAIVIDGRVEHYDLVNSIAHANTGISIGQLLKGDMEEAVTTAKKLVGGSAMLNMPEAMDEKNFKQQPKRTTSITTPTTNLEN